MSSIHSPYDAERNAADWMRRMGYFDAQVTRRGADAGLDVIAENAVAQVKWQGVKVGRPAIQNLFGARGFHVVDMLFFSSSGYTTQAEVWATEHGVALFYFDADDGSIMPENIHAQRLARSGGIQTSPILDYSGIVSKPTPAPATSSSGRLDPVGVLQVIGSLFFGLVALFCLVGTFGHLSTDDGGASGGLWFTSFVASTIASIWLRSIGRSRLS
ncbi:restriction endonuclease [Nocardia sp. NPDC055321]